jgi:mannan polymerase II complex MNN11 subunit
MQSSTENEQEHVVQWHPTILSKLALVPQRIMNAYDVGNETSAYRSGDFVIRFRDCELGGGYKCESEAAPFSKQWRTIFNVQ